MSLKRLNPTSIVKICSVQDPAINKEATTEENISKYSETHDMELLTFNEGEKPTIFHIQNISPEDEAEIQEDHYVVVMPDAEEMKKNKDAKPSIKQVKQQRMFMKYFKAGVKAIEENGKIENLVNVNEWPLSIQQEIGGFVMLRSALGDDEKKS